VVVDIKDVHPAGIYALEDVKGKVLSDYQNKIEADWLKELHSKYKVKVNKKALKHLKRELKRELK
jgi:peptidyl-prolyl cis-trans isomerase SurA